MSQENLENLEVASRFKSNFTNLLVDLSETVQERPDLEAAFQVLKGIINFASGKYLIELFLTTINEKSTPDAKTLLEDYQEGKFFTVLRAFLDKIPIAENLKLGDEIDFMNFDDDNKDMYVDYLHSFFRQGSKYKILKNEL